MDGPTRVVHVYVSRLEAASQSELQQSGDLDSPEWQFTRSLDTSSRFQRNNRKEKRGRKTTKVLRSASVNVLRLKL